MPVTISGGPNTFNLSASVSAPCSVKGGWVVANTDAKTAQSGASLLSPLACTDNAVHWVRVPDRATGMLIRARYGSGLTTAGTQPVVRVFGTSADLESLGAPVADGTMDVWRIDAASPGAAGLTVPVLDAAASLSDGSARYGSLQSLAPLDALGAAYVAVFIQTAATVAAGSSDIAIDVKFLN